MNEECDYYYSARHEQHYTWISDRFGRWIRRTYVNGMVYTECITKGKKPLGQFDDQQLIFSGIGEITFGEYY